MTGENRMIIMTEETLRIIQKVRQLKADGEDAYFSMQTGPSVFINTSERSQGRVLAAVKRLGFKAYASGVGGEARLV
jgi:mevalonate pyrophosphate decarboxylase